METDDRNDLDRAWALEARRGDRVALDALYRRYQPVVLRLCRFMLGRAGDAADAAQEVFVRVVEGLPRYDGVHRFRAWLFAVARHVIVDLLRRSGRWRDAEEDLRQLAPGYVAEALTPVLRAESAARIREALGRLPEPYRLTVLYTAWLDLAPREIAEILGVPPGRVRVHLFRALKLLEKELEDQ